MPREDGADESAEYQAAFAQIEQSHKDALRAFVRWFAREWQENPDQWRKQFTEPVPSPDWFVGWNAGVESAEMALDCFLGDCHP